MASQTFSKAKSWRPLGAEAGLEKKNEWGQTNGKYEPTNFGGSHNWPRNAEWLTQIMGRRIILTDVPLRRSNLMCKVTDDGTPVPDHVSKKPPTELTWR